MKYPKKLIICILCFSILLVIPLQVLANPIPVYPDPKPTFDPQESLSHVQEGSFLIWLLLIWLVDIAINTLFLYAGFLLLVKLKEESYRWFDRISRKKMIIGIFIFSSIGILSEWLIGSWPIGMIVIALVVFISAFFLGKKFFSLNNRSSLVLAVYMVFMNAITWSIIFLL